MSLKCRYIQTLEPTFKPLTVTSIFNYLTTFSASSNYLKSLDCPIPVDSLKVLTLDFNQFTTLFDLIVLRQCSSLEILRLKGNRISAIDIEPYVLTPFHRFGGLFDSVYAFTVYKAD